MKVITRKSRNAKTTRLAILNSAIETFGRHGYDGAGLREIAQAAGVTAMLVGRYFGSKENLFREVVEVGFSRKEILKFDEIRSNAECLSESLTQTLLLKTAKDVATSVGFSLLIRSSSSEVAVKILKEKVHEHFEKPLYGHLRGVGSRERTALLLSLIAGVHLMRQLLQIDSFEDSSHARLSKNLNGIIAGLLQ